MEQDFLKQIQADKIEILVKFMTPNMILKGDTFDQYGRKIKDAMDPFTKEEIADLKKRGFEKLYYIPKKEENKTYQPKKRTIETKIAPKGRYIFSQQHDLMVEIETQKLAIANIEEVFEKLNQGVKVDFYNLITVIKMMLSQIKDNPKGILNLVGAPHHQYYLCAHSINVSILGMICASLFKLNDEQTVLVGLGGFLHDIGKIQIPDEILYKPDKLTPEEFEIIKGHALSGFNILKENGFVQEAVTKTVLLHHEKYNGTGYPLKLKWKDIGLFPHLIAISDVYDALTSKTAYKKPMEPGVAIREILSNSGSAFHPQLTMMFTKYIVGKYKLEDLFREGDYVVLNTNEIAVVQEKGGIAPVEEIFRPEMVFRPSIEIIRDNKKKFKKIPLSIDLSKDPNRQIVKIFNDPKSIESINKQRIDKRK